MPEARILVVDDEPDIRDLLGEILEDEGYRVTSAADGEAARAAFTAERPELVLLDIWMPDVDGITLLKEWGAGGSLPCPVVMMSGHGTLETAVEATRLGAHDFIQKPLSLAKLLATVENALGGDTRPPRATSERAAVPIEPLGSSPAMQLLRQKARQAARHRSPVLITGEAGSGKETVAAYIHRQGEWGGAMVVLDHFQLAGQGARDYLLGADGPAGPGLLERAQGGTLFIPELHQLPEAAQKRLDAVLESGVFTPTGSREEQALDCRLIASAPEHLDQLVQTGQVLEALYYRLNVLPLQVPSLRSRPEDIPELVRFYAEWFPANEGLSYRSFSISALNRLRNHAWPGNVRELRNLVQRLLILGEEGDISAREVEEALRQNAPAIEPVPPSRPESFDLPLREAREQFERDYLVYHLKKAGGSVGKLSEAVGMERTHLYRKLRALGIDPKTAVYSGESQ